MLQTLRTYFIAVLGLTMFPCASFAGTLVFEAEEEEEIIIVDEDPKTDPFGIHFDLSSLGSTQVIAASIFIDLRDDDVAGGRALILIEDFTGEWSATIGSPTAGYTSNISSSQILTAINQRQMLQVELQSAGGSFSYFGSTLTLTTADVPEPGSLVLLVLSLAAFGFYRVQRTSS